MELHVCLRFCQKTVSEIQIDYLTRKIAEVEGDLFGKCNDSSMQYNNDMIHLMGNKYLREPEAILVIKQLHEKVFLNSVPFISYDCFNLLLLFHKLAS